MLLNVAFSELKMKKGKVVLTNRGSIHLSILTALYILNTMKTSKNLDLKYLR